MKTFSTKAIQKNLVYGISFVLFLFFIACTSEEIKESATDVAKQDSTSIRLAEEAKDLSEGSIIRYNGAADDTFSRALSVFTPVIKIQMLSALAIHIKDSVENVRGTQELTKRKDSLLFLPYENRAHQAILAYKQLMSTAPPALSFNGGLLQLNRIPLPGDSSFAILPKAGKSTFLSHGNFFFLGGAPFISKLQPEDKAVYTDAQGNAETRFESTVPENTMYLLNAIYRLKKEPLTISFGAPLRSYENGPQDIKGIGSLVHEFTNRVPVFFLTESGVVPASLVSVTIKLVPEMLGCVSDQPSITFACPQIVDEKEILGIYIPYSAETISFNMTRHGTNVWTADLNNDGIADLACVSDTFQGINSDKMAELLWFVNINGTWKIIDWAQELDCT